MQVENRCEMQGFIASKTDSVDILNATVLLIHSRNLWTVWQEVVSAAVMRIFFASSYMLTRNWFANAVSDLERSLVSVIWNLEKMSCQKRLKNEDEEGEKVKMVVDDDGDDDD